MEDWKIQARATACADTGKPFEEGERFYSAIFLREAEFERKDYCEEAWERLFGARPPVDAPDPGRPFSFWRTRMPGRDEPPRIPYRAAEDFFWQLVEESERRGKRAAAAVHRLTYPLALLLMRKRKLKRVRSERRRGREVLHLTDRSGERTAEIPDPRLDSEAIEEVEREIRKLLFPELAREEDAGEAGDPSGTPDAASRREAPASGSDPVPDAESSPRTGGAR